MKRTLADVRETNRATGHFFFSRSSMRFFNSKIESTLYAKKYFITSERFSVDGPKKFTIREAIDGGADIKTVGEFQAYCSIESAREAIRELVKAEKLTSEVVR